MKLLRTLLFFPAFAALFVHPSAAADFVHPGGLHTKDDATAMYYNALRWYIFGDESYAKCAVRIANDWAGTVRGRPYGDDLSGIPIGSFALAAEVLRVYPGWAKGDFDKFKRMMVEYWYPKSSDFLKNHRGGPVDRSWANWDACNMLAVLGIGVLCDDRAKFDEAVEYFKNGNGMGSIKNAVPFVYPGGLGQWQEAGRDFARTMGGQGLLAEFCQTAWNQGVDLFGADDNKLLKGGEYAAQYTLWQGVLYTFYNNSDNAKQYYISTNYHGRLAASHFELLYNRYVVRKGLTAPNVQRFAALRRPEPGEIDIFGHGTLPLLLFPALLATVAAAPPAPILDGHRADPDIRVFGDTYYVYPTSDKPNWQTTDFSTWSSKDLIHWKNEGIILDVANNLSWANIKAWAPAAAERDGRYYFYFVANEQIGVAVSDKPTGPFKDALGKPLITRKQFDTYPIDPFVFTDTDNQAYLYFGNNRLLVAKLNPDMISLAGAPVDITPKDPAQPFREGIVVFKRKGLYYFMWSVDDANSDNYRVAYGIAKSPLGPIQISPNNLVLAKHGLAKGTGHNGVVNVPGTDRWYVAYHRHAIPNGSGYIRQVCLARMEFNPDGTIKPMDPLAPAFRPGSLGEPLIRGRGSLNPR